MKTTAKITVKIDVSFHKDTRREWRWSAVAKNEEKVGASSEGYQNRIDCVNNASMTYEKPFPDVKDGSTYEIERSYYQEGGLGMSEGDTLF